MIKELLKKLKGSETEGDIEENLVSLVTTVLNIKERRKRKNLT